MNTTLIQMTVLMLCGAGWRITTPNRLSAEQTRLVLTSVVYYFFLPAMVLDVLWRADIGWQSLSFSLLGCASILATAGLSWAICKLCRFRNPQTGAVILAAAFPNVTYLGLPVLEQAFGSWSRSVVIQLDLFAAAPLVFTLGVGLARHYGESAADKPKSPLAFLNAPPFWAAFVAVALNLNQIATPDWLAGLLHTCSGAVAPLMIFSLGLALSWRDVHLRNLPYVVPILLVKLLLMPLFAFWLADYLALAGQFKAAAVLDIAMPSMVLGIVLCDRYRLDSGLYAMAVTLTTACSLFSLPFWFHSL
ncbi:AEC family transporter [Methylomonas sp. HW2-6]|uniref:AEC family transporter n=1 Tax=Methylomonas sp. HW2-6 TaxID=3376687 RepID=UPI0040427490